MANGAHMHSFWSLSERLNLGALFIRHYAIIFLSARCTQLEFGRTPSAVCFAELYVNHCAQCRMR